MSRNPGIGRGWWDKYRHELAQHDSVISRGFPSRPPRYYDVNLELHDFESA